MTSSQIFYIIFTFGGCSALLLGISSVFSRLFFIRKAEKAIATIIDVEVISRIQRRKMPKNYFYPLIQYHFDGEEYEKLLKNRTSNLNKYNKNDKVDIFLDPEDPENVILDNFGSKWGHSIQTIIMGFVILGFVAAVYLVENSYFS